MVKTKVKVIVLKSSKYRSKTDSRAKLPGVADSALTKAVLSVSSFKLDNVGILEVLNMFPINIDKRNDGI